MCCVVLCCVVVWCGVVWFMCVLCMRVYVCVCVLCLQGCLSCVANCFLSVGNDAVCLSLGNDAVCLSATMRRESRKLWRGVAKNTCATKGTQAIPCCQASLRQGLRQSAPSAPVAAGRHPTRKTTVDLKLRVNSASKSMRRESRKLWRGVAKKTGCAKGTQAIQASPRQGPHPRQWLRPSAPVAAAQAFFFNCFS